MAKKKPHEYLTYTQDVKLCEMVSQNPCLYDPVDEQHPDKLYRERVWEDIATKMDVPKDILKNRWRNIRDCYKRTRRENVKRLYGSSDKNRPRKRYLLVEHLHFLEKVEDDKFEDDERRSASLLHQGEVVDGDKMIPNIEVILGAANGGNGFGEVLKQEREDGHEEVEDDGEENAEGGEFHNFSALDPSGGFRVTNVSSTSNVDAAETSNVRNHSSGDQFHSYRKVRNLSKRGKLKKSLLRGVEPNLYQLRPRRKPPTEDFHSFQVQDQPPSPLRYEDDTDMFFRSMALTSKSLHPLVLAELKKKICNAVMDSVIENEKFVANLQPQACYETKTSLLDQSSVSQREDD